LRISAFEVKELLKKMTNDKSNKEEDDCPFSLKEIEGERIKRRLSVVGLLVFETISLHVDYVIQLAKNI
jgi:hypothetical protein